MPTFMPAFPVRTSIIVGCCLAALPLLPAHAGWGKRLARTILPPLITRAAISLIQKELYDVEDREPPRQDVGPPMQPPKPVVRNQVVTGTITNPLNYLP